MVNFDQNIILAADTQSRVDTLLGQFNAFLSVFNTTSTTLQNTITPGTVVTLVSSFDSIATTFDKAIPADTPQYLDNTLKSIESTFVNIHAITSNIQNLTSIVAILIVWMLSVSMLLNVIMVFYLRSQNRTIAELKDQSKKVV
jgi:predicted PurR-regulated permease PerM